MIFSISKIISKIEFINIQVITTKFEDFKYRYLTDITRLRPAFMAASVIFFPLQCASDPKVQTGCGARLEILGSSKRLGNTYLLWFFFNYNMTVAGLLDLKDCLMRKLYLPSFVL